MSPASPINIDYLLLIAYLRHTCSKKHVLPTYEEVFDLLIVILEGRKVVRLSVNCPRSITILSIFLLVVNVKIDIVMAKPYILHYI